MAPAVLVPTVFLGVDRPVVVLELLFLGRLSWPSPGTVVVVSPVRRWNSFAFAMANHAMLLGVKRRNSGECCLVVLLLVSSDLFLLPKWFVFDGASSSFPSLALPSHEVAVTVVVVVVVVVVTEPLLG